MKFTEAKLEEAFTALLADEGYPHWVGGSLARNSEEEVLIEADLKAYLLHRYRYARLTVTEAQAIILQLKSLSSSDLYESNKKIMRWMADGFILKREDRSQKDIHISLIDFSGLGSQRVSENLDIIAAEHKEQYPADTNIYKFVTQFEIVGTERRIPDGILYINGLPVVVFEFKTAIQENTTIHNAYVQLTTRYKRDIPELFKYNAFCVISDGVNSKAGSFFAPYDFYYAWRRLGNVKSLGNVKLQLHDDNENKLELILSQDAEGINSMFTLVKGMLNKQTIRDIIQNFIYIPDSSKKKTRRSYVAIRNITPPVAFTRASKEPKNRMAMERAEPTSAPQEAVRVLPCFTSHAC